jgi:hypothetical protein
MATPKFCKHCQDIVYGNLCPGCERPAGSISADTERENEIAVDDGNSDWGGNDGMRVLSFDEMFDGEGDD